jgi:hypothetical protein
MQGAYGFFMFCKKTKKPTLSGKDADMKYHIS